MAHIYRFIDGLPIKNGDFAWLTRWYMDLINLFWGYQTKMGSEMGSKPTQFHGDIMGIFHGDIIIEMTKYHFG